MTYFNRNTALITGASQGLGNTIATFLAGRGFDLIINARNEANLQQVAQELRQFDRQVLPVAGDIRQPQIRQRLTEAAHHLGRLDLLINNASLLGPSPQPLLVDYPLRALHEVFDANLFAALGLIQAMIPLLAAPGGRIINISSDAALGGYAGWGGYGASKAALDLLTLTLANELRPQGIAVVSVDPGDMRTQMQQDAFPGQDISDRPWPEVTIPFWAWLLGQEPMSITGQRYRAQAETWLLAQADQVTSEEQL